MQPKLISDIIVDQQLPKKPSAKDRLLKVVIKKRTLSSIIGHASRIDKHKHDGQRLSAKDAADLSERLKIPKLL